MAGSVAEIAPLVNPLHGLRAVLGPIPAEDVTNRSEVLQRSAFHLRARRYGGQVRVRRYFGYPADALISRICRMWRCEWLEIISSHW